MFQGEFSRKQKTYLTRLLRSGVYKFYAPLILKGQLIIKCQDSKRSMHMNMEALIYSGTSHSTE
jgi:hypothetical protein